MSVILHCKYNTNKTKTTKKLSIFAGFTAFRIAGNEKRPPDNADDRCFQSVCGPGRARYSHTSSKSSSHMMFWSEPVK